VDGMWDMWPMESFDEVVNVEVVIINANRKYIQ